MSASDPGSRLPEKGYASLRRFRWSSEGSNYFLTFNATRPTDRLSTPELLASFTSERERLERSGAWHVRTWTVMPDHVHALVRLGANTTLGESIRLFKGRLTPALRRDGMTWQDGYYDRQLRDGEDALPVFLYIFLNPYRAHLLPPSKAWPGYYCAAEDWEWFASLTNSETPFPEWLR